MLRVYGSTSTCCAELFVSFISYMKILRLLQEQTAYHFNVTYYRLQYLVQQAKRNFALEIIKLKVFITVLEMQIKADFMSRHSTSYPEDVEVFWLPNISSLNKSVQKKIFDARDKQ